jgi:hypothetical protein
MSLVFSAYTLILFGLVSVYGLSISDLVFCVNSATYYSNSEKSRPSYSNGANMEILPDKTLVEIIKSFKNSSGFYKINGTLENQGSIILSDIKVTKYYKIPSVKDTTLICYEENVANCEYKSTNQQHSERFFLAIPDSNIKSK